MCTHTHTFAITINDFKFFRAVAFREKESRCPCQTPSLFHSHGEGGRRKFLGALYQPGRDGLNVKQAPIRRLEHVADNLPLYTGLVTAVRTTQSGPLLNSFNRPSNF